MATSEQGKGEHLSSFPDLIYHPFRLIEERLERAQPAHQRETFRLSLTVSVNHPRAVKSCLLRFLNFLSGSRPRNLPEDVR